MSEIIHHNPKLPPRVRRDMLSDGEGSEFRWEGRKFEVVRDRSCGLAVVEVDRFLSETEQRQSDAPAKKTIGLTNIAFLGGAIAGSVCLATAAFATTNSGTNSLLLTAIACYAATGVGYLISRKA